jgi:hypothetical protein
LGSADERDQAEAARIRASRTRRFAATVSAVGKRVIVPLPFDPDEQWGHKSHHHVAGTVNGMNVRAVVESSDGQFGIVLGPAWRRDFGIAPGDTVAVLLAPEGPQREDLADDIQRALGENPAAGAAFDGLAQFYRRALLTWIDATKRKPEQRQRRIADTADLLARGEKQVPDER